MGLLHPNSDLNSFAIKGFIILIIITIIFAIIVCSIAILTKSGNDDQIVGITGSYPYYVVLANESKFQVPISHNITNRCGLKWAMEDNGIVNYSDFNPGMQLYWDGIWRGDKAC